MLLKFFCFQSHWPASCNAGYWTSDLSASGASRLSWIILSLSWKGLFLLAITLWLHVHTWPWKARGHTPAGWKSVWKASVDLGMCLNLSTCLLDSGCSWHCLQGGGQARSRLEDVMLSSISTGTLWWGQSPDNSSIDLCWSSGRDLWQILT